MVFDLTDDKMDDFLFKGLVLVLVVVLGILLIFSYINVKPETFTQVYLIPDKIPDSAMIGAKTFAEFEIDNREGKTVDYTYRISFEEQTLVEKTVSVANGEKKRVVEEISFSETFEEKKKVLIEVSKDGMEEPYSVWFWIEVFPSVFLDELQECYDNVPNTASKIILDCYYECCETESESNLQGCFDSCELNPNGLSEEELLECRKNIPEINLPNLEACYDDCCLGPKDKVDECFAVCAASD